MYRSGKDEIELGVMEEQIKNEAVLIFSFFCYVKFTANFFCATGQGNRSKVSEWYISRAPHIAHWFMYVYGPNKRLTPPVWQKYISAFPIEEISRKWNICGFYIE